MQSHTEQKEPGVSGIELLLQVTQWQRPLFIKRAADFTKEEKFSIPDQSRHHEAHVSNKRSGDQKEWIRISNKSIWRDYANRQNALAVLAGETYRFQIGSDTQPKYRIFEHDDGRTEIISKMLANHKEFYSYFETKILNSSEDNTWHISPWKKIYNGNDFFEGMGRVILAKYFYLENDFNSGNSYLTEQHKQLYYVGIDHGETFAPVVAKFYNHDASRKKINYFINREDIEPIKIKMLGETSVYYIIKGKTNTDMGALSLSDYNSLPIIQDHLPRNWYFMMPDEKPYYEKLSTTPLFNNEKHFSAFKILITPFMKEFLTEYHITNEEDKRDIQNLLNNRLNDFSKICQQSNDFKIYIEKYYFAAIQAIIYEMRVFFDDNKHYLPTDISIWRPIWTSLSKEAIHHANILLTQLKINLTEEQQQQLILFAENCEMNRTSVMRTVANFYQQQLMRFHQTMCLEKLNPLTKSKEKNEEISIPKSPDTLFYKRPSKIPATQEEERKNNCVLI